MVGGVQAPLQRSIIAMRTALTTISVAALLAVGAGSAAARPADVPISRNDAPPPAQTDVPTARTDAAQHARAMRSLALHNRRASVASSAQPAQAPTVHVTRVDDGFDWADAGIGAGVATALLLLSAAGLAATRRQPRAASRAR
jgi:hypothetical protein